MDDVYFLLYNNGCVMRVHHPCFIYYYSVLHMGFGPIQTPF